MIVIIVFFIVLKKIVEKNKNFFNSLIMIINLESLWNYQIEATSVRSIYICLRAYS